MKANDSSQTPFQTPLMKQYWELKAQAGDALMFFRMGDFYELFGDDAVEASRILEITLTSRDRNKPNPMPMAGVPHHSAHGYLQRLLDAGKKVAIAEQMEDPAQVSGKAIVQRQIVRVFTPAIQFDAEGSENAYLATAIRVENPAKSSAELVLACVEPSTGELLLGHSNSEDELSQTLQGIPIRHWLSLDDRTPAELNLNFGEVCLKESLPSNFISEASAKEILKSQYRVESLEAFFDSPQRGSEAAILAVGLLVSYLKKSQKVESLLHLRVPVPLQKPTALVLGPRSAQHLDLLPARDGTPSLFEQINGTKSALGARLLKRWILQPLSDSAQIATRQQTVRALADHPKRLQALSGAFSSLYDLERICARVAARLANPRDTLALGKSLALLPELLKELESIDTPALQSLKVRLSESHAQLQGLASRILSTQREEAPFTARDGGIFQPGTDSELDRLIQLNENGQKWLIDLEAKERQATGIPSLKVKYNRVFGYYIEVTSAHLKNVPPHYQRKQTMVGAERFFTDELKKFEEDILTASSKQKALEQELFESLIDAIRENTARIMAASALLAELDSLTALATLLLLPGWTLPTIDDSLDLEISAGRHPMVDAQTRGSFVPNDLILKPDSRRTLLITGPNMGGKSTVMRQAALIVILGQMGAPVPAAAARWGAVSSLYTRIGAHDAIARGQSTFMVEMSELAHILHRADERSLIILDEIGRGTSTYDGISVAWATLEWICKKIQARTLFATHYHELTLLDRELPALANAHMAVEATKAPKTYHGRYNDQRSLRFLYQLRDGAANESFGIHVASIAGLPAAVIERAWGVLENLESQASGRESMPSASDTQLSLFMTPAGAPSPAPEPDPKLSLLDEVDSLNLNELTPIEAMNFLAGLQRNLKQPEFSDGKTAETSWSSPSA